MRITFSFLREAGEGGGLGPLSARRVLAFIFAVAAIALFAWAFSFATAGWFVFIPGLACLASVLLLLFFTTWTDVSGLVSSFKK